MGKIVKFCTACEESFAEKFSFCPNCASELSAFEMTPVAEAPADPAPNPEPPAIIAEEQPMAEEPSAEIPEFRTESEIVETSDAKQPEMVEMLGVEDTVREEAAEPVQEVTFQIDEESIREELGDEWIEVESDVEEEAPAVTVASFDTGEEETKPRVVDSKSAAAGTFLGLLEVEDRAGAGSSFNYDEEELRKYDFEQDPHDENYKVTVISDRSSNTRNGLLLGAFVVIFFSFLSLIVYSLFTNLADVASLVDEQQFVAMLDDVPFDVEEEKPKKEDDDDGGGGGGGGKDEDKPVSKGELVTQTRPPMMPPSPTMPRLTNPSLPVIMSTEGDIKRNRVEAPGLPTALSTEPSSGPGSGGGMGTGRGTGMGSGFGTGEGSGTGSGSGAGNGDGTGDGTGRGSGNPPPVRSGPTKDLDVTYKPRPGYTDEARQNNVRGTVVLSITFQANGSIGSISTVRGLPYGLTEKAIAAARQMRFTPAMRNGQAYTVRKQVHFNFTIY